MRRQGTPCGAVLWTKEVVIPANARIQRLCGAPKPLDYTRLLSRALRAVRYANVRSGILPSQSGLRRNGEQEAAVCRLVSFLIQPLRYACSGGLATDQRGVR